MAGGDIYDCHRVNNIIKKVIKFVGRKFLGNFYEYHAQHLSTCLRYWKQLLCLFIKEGTLGNNVAKMV